MKDTLSTIGLYLGLSLVGVSACLAVKIRHDKIEKEKEERERLESFRFRSLSEDLRKIEFELVKLNSKVSSLKS